MIQALARKITNHFFNEDDKYPTEVYAYGVELLISTIITTFLITLTGILTKSLFECVIFQVAFSLIRVYTGGYHCMTYIKCISISVLSYVFIFLSLFWWKDVFANGFVFFGGYLFSMALSLTFAPVKNENKELTEKDRKRYKLLSLLVITPVYGICALCFYIFGIHQMLVIFPTCVVIDVAMLISVVINIFTRRNSL